MPKDNHSVMQLYLDGFTNNFFTFFFVHEKGSQKIIDKNILSSKKFLKKKRLMDITYAQKQATENIFKKKGIPFRSFEIFKRDEKTLGELFNFFILETIGSKPLFFLPKLSAISCWYQKNKFSELLS